jgi:hypothetical protein
MLRRLIAAAAVATCLLLPTAPAFASGADVIKDCLKNGRLTHTYSQKEYKQALANMPTDVAEYSDCQAVIRAAQVGLGRGSGTGTGREPFSGATPQEAAAVQQQIAAAQKTGGKPQRIGTGKEAKVVTPGALSYRAVSAATSELPTPLLVLVVLILLCAGYAAAQLYRHRERSGGPGS